MAQGKAEIFIRALLSEAGITVNGDKPFDIQVHNNKYYQRILTEGALGLGESYMDSWWDCKALDQFFDRVTRADLESRLKGSWKLLWPILKSKLFNLQKSSRAYQVGEQHYDIGNNLFQVMLDKRMNYSCGYWKNANNLDEAQEAKLEMVCQKINLEPGMKVLDIGCGFGSFAGYAAEKYGARVTGITVSRQQYELGNEQYDNLPVELKLMDYRDIRGMYDRVISIGLMEHIGCKNYQTYMEVVNRTLKDDGIAFIQTIGGNVSTYACNPWTVKYIFPNSMLPSMTQLGNSMEGLFIMEDWHNIGPHYDKTLMAWYHNFEQAWVDLKPHYGDRFFRMWKYYLLSCAGLFRSRDNQLWQIVMSKPHRDQPLCRFS